MFKYNERKIFSSKCKSLVFCTLVTLLLFALGIVIPVTKINFYIFLIGLLLIVFLISLKIFIPWWSPKRNVLANCIGAIGIAMSLACLPIAAKLIIHGIDAGNTASFILAIPFFAGPLMASAYKRIAEI